MLIKGLSCTPDTLAGALAQSRHTWHSLGEHWCLGHGSSLAERATKVLQMTQREGLRPRQNRKETILEMRGQCGSGVVCHLKVRASED